MRVIRIPPIRLALPLLAGMMAAAPAAAQPPSADPPVLEMRPCALPDGQGMARCGTFWPLENREEPGGRRIPVDVVVLSARDAAPRPDPVFVAAGGPGQAATELAGYLAGTPMNGPRDVVLVDQRGTSAAHALECRLAGSAENPQGYLEPIFSREAFRRCRTELEGRADLTRYTTREYVDDLDEVRRALGYGRINLQGVSYGTRVVLVYLRHHPRHVRTAFMAGLFPPTSRSPLYHARDTQAALDSVFALCGREAECARAFPHLRRAFAETMDRLRRAPAAVTVAHPSTGAPVRLSLDADAFAEAVRTMMYDWERTRRLPLLLHRAHGGDYAPFAAAGLRSNIGLRGGIRFGLGLSVLCSEDMPRITQADIVAETRGTFAGDTRVRTQRAACEEWPRRALPAGTGDPVVSDVPALLVSGAYDPVTPARWGDEAARTLRNSLHVVVPAAHTAGSPCVDRIRDAFLDRGTVGGLDTSCVEEMPRGPFIVSGEDEGQE